MLILIKRDKLNECQSKIGAESFHIILDNMDKDILLQFKHVLLK